MGKKAASSSSKYLISVCAVSLSQNIQTISIKAKAKEENFSITPSSFFLILKHDDDGTEVGSKMRKFSLKCLLDEHYLSDSRPSLLLPFPQHFPLPPELCISLNVLRASSQLRFELMGRKKCIKRQKREIARCA